MSEWIKVRKTLLRDGRVLEAARKCKVSPTMLLGGLIVMWSLADDYAEADGRIRGYTPQDIDRETRIRGFCAALPEDWIHIDGDEVTLPQYLEHNGETAKQRAQSSRRKSRQRNGSWKSQRVDEALRTRHAK